MKVKMSTKIQTARTLWFAIFCSQFVFVFVVFTLQSTGSLLEYKKPDALFVALCFVSLSLAVMSFIVPAWVLGASLRRQGFAIEERIDPDAVGMYRESAPRIRVFANPTEAREKALGLFITPLILSLGLSEAIGVCGLVAGFTGTAMPYFLPLIGFAALLIAIRFPRLATIDSALELACDAKIVDEHGPA